MKCTMCFNAFNLNIIFTCIFFFNDRLLIHVDTALITEKYELFIFYTYRNYHINIYI